MTNSVSDLLHASSDRLWLNLPPAATVRRAAERRRRKRRIAAFVAPVVLAALVLWMGAAGPLRNSADPPSPATPGPDPSGGLFTLASDPFLTEVEGYPVQPGAAPVALSPCVISPLTRDASESGAATYGRRGQQPFANEFVIRFNTVAAAHHAVIDAWHQFRRCPTPPNVHTDPLRRPGPPTTIYRLSELFANQHAGFATRHGTYPTSMYSLRVGRWRNVVVILETTSSSDRADYVLWQAMFQATRKWPETTGQTLIPAGSAEAD